MPPPMSVLFGRPSARTWPPEPCRRDLAGDAHFALRPRWQQRAGARHQLRGDDRFVHMLRHVGQPGLNRLEVRDEREAGLALYDKLPRVNRHLPAGPRDLDIVDVPRFIEMTKRQDCIADTDLDWRVKGLRVQ